MITASVIKLLHLILVILLVASVFINNCLLKELALTFLVYLFFQYLLGWKKCGLTQLEYWILGEEKYQQGFIYRLINPLVEVPEKYFYHGLFIFHILWTIILFFQVRQKCF